MAIAATDLLNRYGFDVGAFSADQLVGYWLRSYPALWVRAAVIEALYQGRYKSVSVGQILAIWKRRGQPIYHYGFEFERMVCGHLSRIPTQEVGMQAEALPMDAESAESTELASSPLPSDLEPPADNPASPGPEEDQRFFSSPPDEEGSKAFQEQMAEAIAESFSSLSAHTTGEFELVTPHNWSPKPTEAGTHPIDQFVPDSEISMFYEKLRAVAQDQQN